MLIRGTVLNVENQYQTKELRDFGYLYGVLGKYNNTSNMESECLFYCFRELIQRDLDCFKNSWSSHRRRRQMNSN